MPTVLFSTRLAHFFRILQDFHQEDKFPGKRKISLKKKEITWKRENCLEKKERFPGKGKIPWKKENLAG